MGFESAELEGLNVEITRVTDAKLKIGQVATVATVNEAAETVDTRTATTGDVITGTHIRDIPLPTRNFLDLTALQAGVLARIQSAATVGRGAPILDVAGSRATTNNFVLDGEAGNLQFRAEAFKVFNNAIFANPQANISNVSTFGHITSTLDSTGLILQLALKLSF